MYLQVDTDSTLDFYDQVTQLEGVQYLLRFWWGERESAWYLDIYDQDENPIATFIRLNVSWPLLRRFADERLPRGVLSCVDMTGNNQDIVDKTDLGSRVLLVYITSDDPDLATA